MQMVLEKRLGKLITKMIGWLLQSNQFFSFCLLIQV
jgi:hypothetical protein